VLFGHCSHEPQPSVFPSKKNIFYSMDSAVFYVGSLFCLFYQFSKEL